jgi:hypothetical protein
MAAPKAPVQGAALMLSDPNNVPDVFANSLAGIQVRDGGLCHLTFGVMRPKHSGTGNAADEYVVSARLILPFPVLEGICGMVADIKKAVALNAMTSSDGPAN